MPGDLVLEKPNRDGLITTRSIKAVNSYKYLGIIFDPGLKWTMPQSLHQQHSGHPKYGI